MRSPVGDRLKAGEQIGLVESGAVEGQDPVDGQLVEDLAEKVGVDALIALGAQHHFLRALDTSVQMQDRQLGWWPVAEDLQRRLQVCASVAENSRRATALSIGCLDREVEVQSHDEAGGHTDQRLDQGRRFRLLGREALRDELEEGRLGGSFLQEEVDDRGEQRLGLRIPRLAVEGLEERRGKPRTAGESRTFGNTRAQEGHDQLGGSHEPAHPLVPPIDFTRLCHDWR